MKKVLFATTALVATAGVAAADVTFGGYGRFGLQHREDRGVGLDDTIIDSRFRLDIDASTESDAGVTFGARVRIQADERTPAVASPAVPATATPASALTSGAANQAVFSGARFHAETGGFRLEVGNISHALDNMANYYGYEPGLIGAVGQYNNFTGPVTGFSSTGAGVNGVSAIYSVGDFRGQLSYDGDTDGSLAVDPLNTDMKTVSASVAYTFSGWTVALGYEKSEDDDGVTENDGTVLTVGLCYEKSEDDDGVTENDGTVLTVGGSLGVADVAFFIGDADGRDTSYGISGRFDVGAATAIVASIAGGGDGPTPATDLKTSYGIGFDHDLGGGVKLLGMVGRNNTDQTVADLGVKFSF